MAVNNNFIRAPKQITGGQETLHLFQKAINSALSGKINCTGELTIAHDAATTAIINNLCNVNSVILLQPLTAHAAAALADTYVIAGEASFTVHHANNVQTDRNFKYVILG
jgi:hypothetical protein